MNDRQMATNRRFRVLNIVDAKTRERLAAIPDTSISGERVGRELSDLIAVRGKSGMIVSDNGAERGARKVRRDPLEMALHRTGRADPERLRRKLQRPHARQVAQRDAVRQHRAGPREISA